MNEKMLMSNAPESEAEKEKRKEKVREEMIALAMELGERKEGEPFSGISPETYAKMKATDEEFPGYTTPVDELLKKFNDEGLKVVPGKNPEKGTVYILPLGSVEVEVDGIFPEQLEISEEMDEKLKSLILKRREFVALCKG